MGDILDDQYLLLSIIPITLVTILIYVFLKRRNQIAKPQENKDENNSSISEVSRNIEENNRINELETIQTNVEQSNSHISTSQTNYVSHENQIEDSYIYTDTPSNHSSHQPNHYDVTERSLIDQTNDNSDQQSLVIDGNYEPTNNDTNIESNIESNINNSDEQMNLHHYTSENEPHNVNQINYQSISTNNIDINNLGDQKEVPTYKPINSDINTNNLVDNDKDDTLSYTSNPSSNTKLDQILNRATKFTSQSTTNSQSYTDRSLNNDTTPISSVPHQTDSSSSSSSYLTSVEEKYKKYLERSSTLTSSLGTSLSSSNSSAPEKSDDPSVEIYCKDYTVMNILSSDSPDTPLEIQLEKSLTGYFKTKLEKCTMVKFILKNGDLSTEEIEIKEPGEYYFFYGRLRKM